MSNICGYRGDPVCDPPSCGGACPASGTDTRPERPHERTVTCDECGYSGSIDAVKLHDCDIARNGGRCEDYPCCGHTDGDGCQTLPEHTSAYYYEHPERMYEPGSPEWYDALEEM